MNRQGFWVYPFLDWHQGGKAAIWYIAVGVICIVAFFIQFLIHYLRELVARKLKGEKQHQDKSNVEENKLEVEERKLEA